MTEADINVLVIDDVNSIRVQIKELMRSMGFKKIKAAASPEEAIAMLEGEKFELVLCDWHMAPFDGLEILRYVRRTPQHATSAFVMVTAEGTRERVIEAVQSGVDDYVLKPLTAASIKTKVYAALKKRQVLA